MENKNNGTGDKMILGYFGCTMDKMDRDGGNKIQRIYRCCSNYSLSKPIVDNRVKHLWKRKNLDSSEFAYYDRSSGTIFRIGGVYVY